MPRRKYPPVVSYAETTKRETASHHESQLDELQMMSVLWFPAYEYAGAHGTKRLQLLPLRDCFVESGTSLVAGAHGLYRSAAGSLRILLELASTAVLFDLDPTQIGRYETRDRTPSRKELESALTSRRIVRMRRVLWRKHARQTSLLFRPTIYRSLYQNTLSKPTHGHLDTWTMTMGPEYNRRSFTSWAATFKRVHTLTLGMVLSHFPEIVEFWRSEPTWIGTSWEGLSWESVFGSRMLTHLNLAAKH
jgi:hypothetical protein